VNFITIRTRDDGQDREFCLDIGHERPLLTYCCLVEADTYCLLRARNVALFHYLSIYKIIK